MTPLHFISQHLYQGVVFSDDKTVSGDPIDSKMLQKIRRHVDYFSVLAIKQDFMLKKQFDDQTIAAAVILGARKASKVVRTAWHSEAFSRAFKCQKDDKEVTKCLDILLSAYDKTHKGGSPKKQSSKKGKS